jgi:class 3 adenylate cyclase
MATCPRCRTATEGAKFCPECGAPQGAAERRERRVVSVLFADLAGFTSRSERLDVEDVEGFLDPYLQLLRRQVESKGGTVAKSTGDGVMALFGALVAHEDDAERAVRCAIAIRDAMTQETEDALHVRVGVTSGEVLVSHGAAGELDAIGDVVNTAARLESAAPTDGVLVDEFTYRATSRAIRYEELEPVGVKGKSELVPVWQALEPRSIVPEQARLGGLPLVGRDPEADILRHALDRSRREPSTQLVTIIGEPGIGKTRLVEELREYVESIPELLTWRRGRSLSYGEGIAFWALGEMVKSQAGILESDGAAVAEAKLAEAADAVLVDEQVRDWVVRRLRTLVGLETTMPAAGEGGRGEAFGAWRRFFEALAEQGPTVLVFEDLHWADDALLDFVDLLADRAGAVPLLIVCTARPELLERRQHWGGGKANATTISLTPLSPDDTARLVGELLHQPLLPAEVQQALLERAEGNPLYAQEYVRMLQDRGLLAQGDGGWALTGQVEGLPESIHGIIAARLDTLSAQERGLLRDAAVVGRTAWLGAVRALTERSAWEAEELLQGLERSSCSSACGARRCRARPSSRSPIR